MQLDDPGAARGGGTFRVVTDGDDAVDADGVGASRSNSDDCETTGASS
ncbi:MAG: hypothetical protein IT177_25125 [Acidobacteria bacterium]|nr:hypothetical protein [Acidobacteriota bacterium]